LKAFINICGIEAELTIPNSKDNPVMLEAPYLKKSKIYSEVELKTLGLIITPSS